MSNRFDRNVVEGEYHDSDIYDIPGPDIQPSSLTWLVWPVVFLALALFLSAIFGAQ